MGISSHQPLPVPNWFALFLKICRIMLIIPHLGKLEKSVHTHLVRVSSFGLRKNSLVIFSSVRVIEARVSYDSSLYHEAGCSTYLPFYCAMLRGQISAFLLFSASFDAIVLIEWEISKQLIIIVSDFDFLCPSRCTLFRVPYLFFSWQANNQAVIPG